MGVAGNGRHGLGRGAGTGDHDTDQGEEETTVRRLPRGAGDGTRLVSSRTMFCAGRGWYYRGSKTALWQPDTRRIMLGKVQAHPEREKCQRGLRSPAIMGELEGMLDVDGATLDADKWTCGLPDGAGILDVHTGKVRPSTADDRVTKAHPARVEVDAALVAGTSYRHVATWHGLKMSAVFRHRRAHLAEPIRVRPCSGCGGPLDGASSRCAACRTAAGAQQQRRQRRAVDKAWLLTADARWSSDPELRRQRQAAGLCVVCALARQDGRHWCCSRAHEKLRQHTLHRVLNE